LNNALSGLAAAQRGLSVTANNAANVNTEGYSRKAHQQTSMVLGGAGSGVRILDGARITDPFLRESLRARGSDLARSTALDEIYKRLDSSVFGDAQNSLTSSLDRLRAAIEAAANSPEKLPLKGAVVDAAADLANDVNKGLELIQGLRHQMDEQIAAEVDGINRDLEALAALNEQFARKGETPELADERDRVLDRLGSRLEIKVTLRDDGRAAVYAGGGQTLLDHTPRHVQYDPAAAATRTTVFGAIEIFTQGQLDPATGEPALGEVGKTLVSGGVRAELTPELASASPIRSTIDSGRIQGLIEARDSLLPELDDQVVEFSRLLRHALDAAHNAANALPPPQSVTGSRTDHSGSVAAANSGTAYLSLVDASGSVVRTIAIDVTAATPAAMAAQIAADLGADGTASVGADGRLTITATDPTIGLAFAEGDSQIIVGDTAGHSFTYGFAHYFGLNDLFAPIAGDIGRIEVRDAIAAAPSMLASAMLDVEPGAPPTAVLGGEGDNRGLQGLADAFEARLGSVARGDLPARDTDVAGYLRDLVGVTAIKAVRNEASLSADQAIVDHLTEQNSAVSGVNLDEEMAKLVLYQQAYTVSARIIQMTDRLFDELLAIRR
jgi:flagellar hook-associated protein 1 FlgK